MKEQPIVLNASAVIAKTASSWGLTAQRPMRTAVVLVSLLLAACASSLPQISTDRLPPEPPAEFKEKWTLAAPAEAQPRGEWWKAFDDPVLDGLIERANQGNASVRIAAT